MNFPRQFIKQVEIYHVPTTAGAKQSYTADVTTTGCFLPMDRYASAIEASDLQNPHELYVESSVDIRVGDKVVIDSNNYFVKHVFDAYDGVLQHKRASLSSKG